MGKKRRLNTSQKFNNKYSSHPAYGGAQINTVVTPTVDVTTPIQTNVVEIEPPVTETVAATVSTGTTSEIETKATKTTKTTTNKNVVKNSAKTPKTTKSTRTTARKTKSSTNKSS